MRPQCNLYEVCWRRAVARFKLRTAPALSTKAEQNLGAY